MTILAFLQNLWVKDPGRMRKMIALHGNEEFRLMLIRQLLFSGCLTGRRIKACFGDLLLHMIFEETTREIAGDARTVLTPDPEHIQACLETHKPKIILTFGRIAAEALDNVCFESKTFLPPVPIIHCPHPAARQADTVAKLKNTAEQLRKMIGGER